MIARTTNSNSKNYKNYGAKGITVCERWLNFEGFWEDMGERPSGNHSLDRIDSSKGYFKENCRWATLIEQNNNTSRNRFLDFEGKRQTLTQWAREMGLSPICLTKRINAGWTIERALKTPSSKKKFEHD